MIEIRLEDIEDFDLEEEESNAFFNLFEWLDDELEIQPKRLRTAILNGESKLSINYNPGGIE